MYRKALQCHSGGTNSVDDAIDASGTRSRGGIERRGVVGQLARSRWLHRQDLAKRTLQESLPSPQAKPGPEGARELEKA